MSMLWLGIVLLIALAVAFLFIPFILRLSRGELIREQNNVEIYKSQLVELAAEKEAGNVSEADYDALVVEVKRNLLSDTKEPAQANNNEKSGRWMVPLLCILTIVSSILLYDHLGFENEVAIMDLLKRSNTVAFTKEDSQELLVRLKDKTAKEPKDIESWYMQGRINFEMGNYPESVKGFSGALANLPNDAKEDQSVAMAQLAQAKFFAADRTLDDVTQSLLHETLKINPQETTALGLLGVAAFDAKDFMSAIKYWQRLLALIPASNPNAVAIQGGIDKAMSQLKPEQVAAIKAKQVVKSVASIIVTVDLSKEIMDQVPENADLFILAKAASGPPMPLAVKRLSNNTWPITVVLDDSMAMMPSLKMSNFNEIIITARISKSGVANTKPGDIEGDSGVITVNSKKTHVVIDKIIQ